MVNYSHQMRLSLGGLIVDNFAGGGGASVGIEAALGLSPDIAINHDPEAVAMHVANHPATKHFCEDVWDVDPLAATKGQPVSLAWFSPDCKHFSKAKGSKPRDKSIRGLAWVVVYWAQTVQPRVIILENVEEFKSWGPLLDDGMPCPKQKGSTFRRWINDLEECGYDVEYQELKACDYGAPTIRKRLFVIARCDDLPIVWPKPTHGPGTLQPYHTAAECIEWTIPVNSIFERKKPLADNTLRRIARGVFRFVIDDADPFIIPVTHQGDSRIYGIREPMRTITGANRGEHAFISPTLIQSGYGERPGQVPRVPGLHQPLGTVVAGGVKHALVAAFLAKHYGGNESPGTKIPLPLSTITAKDHHALVTSHILKMRHHSHGSPMGQPLDTITAGGQHFGEVRAFLTKYYSKGPGASLKGPMHTVTSKDRFGLVTVQGQDYAISDIGMRMLIPRELYRAQGFPDSYHIEIPYRGKPLTKTAQVKMVGNSVSPPVAEALVRANVAPMYLEVPRAMVHA